MYVSSLKIEDNPHFPCVAPTLKIKRYLIFYLLPKWLVCAPHIVVRDLGPGPSPGPAFKNGQECKFWLVRDLGPEPGPGLTQMLTKMLTFDSFLIWFNF